MDREIDRLIVKYVFQVKMAQKSEAYLEGWLDGQNFYSAKMEDAWKVVDHLKEKYEVELHLLDGMTNVIVTERFPDGHLKDRYQGYETSTPLAICMAALKSVGIEIHDGKGYQIVPVQ